MSPLTAIRLAAIQPAGEPVHLSNGGYSIVASRVALTISGLD